MFRPKSFHGKPAYKFLVEARDPMRPKTPVIVGVVVFPPYAKPIEAMLADGKPLAGVKARFEGSFTQGYYTDPQTGRVAPTVNVFAKAYEIFSFDGPSSRVAADGIDVYSLPSPGEDMEGEESPDGNGGESE
ncbi:MAG: hypothetical protein IJS52_10555 [Bacilli bacterium]|nr:hypothetical protein [Bacilli bacterium]